MPRRSREKPPEPEAASLVLAGRAWWGGRLQPLEVGIGEEGRIVAVGRSLRGSRRRDLGEKVLIPSGVDLHVHLRDPGPPGAAESIPSGTLQAVLGGVGTVGEMPNTDPPVDAPEALRAKERAVRGRAACDVLLYAAARDARSARRLGGLAGGFKLYLSPTTHIEVPVPDGQIPRLLEAVRATDLPIAVHAERPEEFRGTPTGPDDLAGWNAHRPPEAERAALDRLLPAAGPLRLHVAHVTHVAALEAVTRAGYSAEVTPHHLLLSDRSRAGAVAKVNPPLRSEADRQALFAAFAAGKVPVLASDHAPHPPEAKARPFPEAPAGIPSLETMLPMFLALAARGEVPLPVLQSASADRPARWLGLPVGRLRPGHEAHLYAVDFRARRSIRARDLHGPGAPTPYEGREAVFPTEHYVRGKLVVDGGEYVGGPDGRVVRPEYARSPGAR